MNGKRTPQCVRDKIVMLRLRDNMPLSAIGERFGMSYYVVHQIVAAEKKQLDKAKGYKGNCS